MVALENMERAALSELEAAVDAAALEAWEAKYLGRRGQLTVFLRGIGQLPAEERPGTGQAANRLRLTLQERHRARSAEAHQSELLAALERETVDVTMPGRRTVAGTLHPVTQTLRRIYEIFGQMGFQVYNSPDVETDERNFELLNIPPHHPARDMWDTFYVSDSVVLRTHTSPGQIHAMRAMNPWPIRVILPGKCYRYEQVTTRHESQFYQVEGLVVGHGITMSDLKGVFAEFTRQMYGSRREMRFRSSYFPFTEPSVEIDMDCAICGGDGCRLCKQTGWLEIGGAGLVHPVVLRNGGYDPEQYSGFAFGFGPERVALLLYGIDDIRMFYANDLRFLQQFGRLI